MKTNGSIVTFFSYRLNWPIFYTYENYTQTFKYLPLLNICLDTLWMWTAKNMILMISWWQLTIGFSVHFKTWCQPKRFCWTKFAWFSKGYLKVSISVFGEGTDSTFTICVSFWTCFHLDWNCQKCLIQFWMRCTMLYNHFDNEWKH